MDTVTKSCSPTIVISGNGEVQTHEEAILCVKKLDIFLTMKVLDNTPTLLSLGKLCDENGFSYEWINGQKPHLIGDGVRVICNAGNFVPNLFPGLSSSFSGSSSTLPASMKQESRSSSSSSSPSSPTVGEIQVREREDARNSDISSVPVSNLVDDRSGQPEEIQANKTPQTIKKDRNNHRYVVVVQDLATRWIQAYPCKNKTSQETQRSLQKFPEPERKPKVICTHNSLEFGKACENVSWNPWTSTPHRSETNGIAERAVRRVKEGTSAVLLQSGLNENWWAESMECFTYLRNVTDLLSDGKTPYERRFWATI